MFEYREVLRCKECGKIYDNGWRLVPDICGKCGNRLYTAINYSSRTLRGGEWVIAKPTLRGWVIKK